MSGANWTQSGMMPAPSEPSVSTAAPNALRTSGATAA